MFYCRLFFSYFWGLRHLYGIRDRDQYERCGQVAKINAQYEEPDSKVESAASWSSLKRLQSSCQVSWCVLLKLLAHLRTVVEIGICKKDNV